MDPFDYVRKLMKLLDKKSKNKVSEITIFITDSVPTDINLTYFSEELNDVRSLTGAKYLHKIYVFPKDTLKVSEKYVKGDWAILYKVGLHCFHMCEVEDILTQNKCPDLRRPSAIL